MQDQHNQENNRFNEILIDIIRKLYSTYGKSDMSTALDFTLYFDDQQRISRFENLLVDGLPKVPDFEIVEELNKISTQIRALSEKYRLDNFKVSVKSGGQMEMFPVYRVN